MSGREQARVYGETNDHTLNRRRFLSIGASTAGMLALPQMSAEALAQEAEPGSRPNILWLVSEDSSPYLGTYGYDIPTPTLDRMAAEGIRYDNAFSSAPVCAPTRFGIITGMEATACGPAHHHRASGNIPDWLLGFPAYLRDAGYYCTNNGKRDYNAPIDVDRAWDESSGSAHWRDRPAGAPFFSVFNYTVTHEGQTFPGVNEPLPSGPDPSDVDLPAYHPDGEHLRADRALHYDQMTRLDGLIAERLAQLEADGLADDTIIFFYSDHGGAQPRSKRYCYDSGLRIPLIVRFPAKWAHLAPSSPGTTVPEPVSQLDFAPTVLSLAGVAAPSHMHGVAFAGTLRADTPRRYAFSFRNRMDERYDMSRTVTDGRYRYTRNYHPHLSYAQHVDYGWRQLGYQEWERYWIEGRLNDVQAAFWREKPVEELYDTTNDPDEVDNLAGDGRHLLKLDELRDRLDAHLIEMNDNGFIPETSPLQGYDASRSPGAYPIEAVMQVAGTAIARNPANVQRFVRWLDHDSEPIRYWAALGCVMLRGAAEDARAALAAHLDDDSPPVRVAAAEALCWLRETERGLDVLRHLMLNHEAERVRLQAANAFDHLGPLALPTLDALEHAAGQDRDLKVRQAATHTAAVLRGEYPQAPRNEDGLSIDCVDQIMPGESTTVTVALVNNGDPDRSDVRLGLRVPDGWEVRATSPVTFDKLTAGESVQASFEVSIPEAGEPGPNLVVAEATYRVEGRQVETLVGTGLRVLPLPPSVDSYLSDLPWISAVNGWGPVERDMSNGERRAGDGNTISLAGVSYAKGLGVHAYSEIAYHLGGQCTRFTAVVGVDDEVGTGGGVAFKVFADDVQRYQSEFMTAGMQPASVDVDVRGARILRLVVTREGAGRRDHADWADAYVYVR